VKTTVSVLRLAPEIRYHQPMSRIHQGATHKVHGDFHTRAGHYSSKLYDDPWTGRVAAVAQLARLRVLGFTVDGLTSADMLPAVQAEWDKAQEKLAATQQLVRDHWSDVIAAAQSRLGDTYDSGAYPASASAWGVSARLHITSADVPAELSDVACQGLKTEAESALRDKLIQGQQQAIEEVKELVAKVATSKRAEKTRKAGIRRISRLRRINLLADPAYDAVCAEAIRDLQSGSSTQTFDVDFANPFGG